MGRYGHDSGLDYAGDGDWSLIRLQYGGGENANEVKAF